MAPPFKKMKYCPFCGETKYLGVDIVWPEEREPYVGEEKEYIAGCTSCQTSAVYGKSKRDAIDNWNRRTPPKDAPRKISGKDVSELIEELETVEWRTRDMLDKINESLDPIMEKDKYDHP